MRIATKSVVEQMEAAELIKSTSEMLEWHNRLKGYKIRTCRYLNECCVCLNPITDGQKYHDGGYGRRAHVGCVDFSIDPKPPLHHDTTKG